MNLKLAIGILAIAVMAVPCITVAQDYTVRSNTVRLGPHVGHTVSRYLSPGIPILDRSDWHTFVTRPFRDHKQNCFERSRERVCKESQAVA